jgi:hypothetical protein
MNAFIREDDKTKLVWMDNPSGFAALLLHGCQMNWNNSCLYFGVQRFHAFWHLPNNKTYSPVPDLIPCMFSAIWQLCMLLCIYMKIILGRTHACERPAYNKPGRPMNICARQSPHAWRYAKRTLTYTQTRLNWLILLAEKCFGVCLVNFERRQRKAPQKRVRFSNAPALILFSVERVC